MPTYLWRTEIFSIPTTLLELMIYVLFLMWLFKKVNHESRITNYDSILITGIILLFLGLTISTAVSTDIKTSAGIMKGWFADPFLFFLVLINVVKTKKQIVYLFGAWALSGLVVAVISLIYLMIGDLTYDDRLKSFFLSPNHLAMYLSPPFLMLLIFLLRGKIAGGGELKILDIGYWKLGNWKLEIGKLRNWEIERLLDNVFQVSSFKFQVSSLIIIFIPLYFTYSYGAFLGIAAVIVCLVIPLLRGGWGCVKKLHNPPLAPPERGIINGKSVNFTAIILCLLILSSFLFLSADKFQQIADSENRSSFHSRLMIWNVSKEILRDNFIFGIGPGTFQKVYLSYANKFDELYLEWAVPQPHNIFLAFWLQTGIIGLLGFILILVWFFQSGLKYKNNNIQYPISNILILLMIYFIIHGLIDTTYWKNDLSLMFWILTGIMVVCRELSIRK